MTYADDIGEIIPALQMYRGFEIALEHSACHFACLFGVVCSILVGNRLCEVGFYVVSSTQVVL